MPAYTQTTSKVGFSAAHQPRNLPILTESILLILSRLRSTNFDSFEIAQKQLLRLFGYAFAGLLLKNFNLTEDLQILEQI